MWPQYVARINQKQRKMPWRDRKNHLDLFEIFFLFYETWDWVKWVDQKREGTDLKQLEQLNVKKSPSEIFTWWGDARVLIHCNHCCIVSWGLEAWRGFPPPPLVQLEHLVAFTLRLRGKTWEDLLYVLWLVGSQCDDSVRPIYIAF